MIRSMCVLIGLLAFSLPAFAAKPVAKPNADSSTGKKTAKADATPKTPATNGSGTNSSTSNNSPVSDRDPLPLAKMVDSEVDRLLREATISASLPTSDSEFLRRVTIDIVGRIPTAEKAQAFVADKSPDKRQKAIDELLADKEYGTNFGTIWYHLLVVPNDDNRRLVKHTFADWMSEQFDQNRGWDKIVQEILTVEGELDTHPATVFWFAHSEGNKDAKLKPQEALASATQRFLGTQYQCAECHNHPFTGFPQKDFWSMAAYFGKTNFTGAGKMAAKKGTGDPAVHEKAPGQASIEIPEKKGVLVTAKLPDGTVPSANSSSLRSEFAKWCTSPKNDAFARAAVNRMWSHFYGRGIVEPVDDFREGNNPSHPELLKALAEEFTASGYDLKHLVRCICNSKAYQRSSDTTADNVNDEKLFSHMALKAMSAEVMLNSLTTAAGHDLIEGRKSGREGGGKKGNQSPAGQFIAQFNTSEEPDLPDYSHGVPQVLRLMNSGDLEKSCPTLDKLTSANASAPNKVIEGLYWSVLSRPPRPTETQKMSAYLAKSNVAAPGGPTKAYRDMFWVLLNSGEFVLNH